jgi:hypothetical protein
MTLYVGKPPPRSAGRRALRGVLLFLLLWFLLWLVIGWVIRDRMERPVRFIGRSAEPDSSLAFATLPLFLCSRRTNDNTRTEAEACPGRRSRYAGLRILRRRSQSSGGRIGASSKPRPQAGGGEIRKIWPVESTM